MNTITPQLTKKIDRILKDNQLSWEDLIKEYKKNFPLKKTKKDIWEQVKGMWAKKKIDPLKYERKIRKELERNF